MVSRNPTYAGLLMIGDPHLEGRQPGFRKDDYPQVILNKLAWCLDYAREHRLLPVILGDLFDKPRDNPNWMIVRLLEMLQGEIIGLYGNHDCADPELCPHDSLSLLITSGRLRLVNVECPWRGTIGGRPVIVGGSSYRQKLPERFDPPPEAQMDNVRPLVIWLAHHDLAIPGYDEGKLAPKERPGIDLVINGHIHRRLEPVATGRTLWITPGNISRRKRSDVTRDHVPSVLRVDVSPSGYELSYMAVPHQPFDEVFHEAVADAAAAGPASTFVAGLAELQARRTASGAGLMEFLDQHVRQFDSEMADEIMCLATEVTESGNENQVS